MECSRTCQSRPRLHRVATSRCSCLRGPAPAPPAPAPPASSGIPGRRSVGSGPGPFAPGSRTGSPRGCRLPRTPLSRVSRMAPATPILPVVFIQPALASLRLLQEMSGPTTLPREESDLPRVAAKSNEAPAQTQIVPGNIPHSSSAMFPSWPPFSAPSSSSTHMANSRSLAARSW